jgi:hypothetical protein
MAVIKDLMTSLSTADVSQGRIEAASNGADGVRFASCVCGFRLCCAATTRFSKDGQEKPWRGHPGVMEGHFRHLRLGGPVFVTLLALQNVRHGPES